MSFSWTREAILTQRDSIEDNKSIPDNATHENDAATSSTACRGRRFQPRMTSELKASTCVSLLQVSALFDDN